MTYVLDMYNVYMHICWNMFYVYAVSYIYVHIYIYTYNVDRVLDMCVCSYIYTCMYVMLVPAAIQLYPYTTYVIWQTMTWYGMMWCMVVRAHVWWCVHMYGGVLHGMIQGSGTLTIARTLALARTRILTLIVGSWEPSPPCDSLPPATRILGT